MKRLMLMLLAAAATSASAGDVKIGDEKTVAEAAELGRARVAYGDGVYLVVWQDGWAGVNPTADIRARRCKAESLEPLDERPIAVCTAAEAQDAPAVAFADGRFLVVWQDMRSGSDLDVRGVLLDAKTGKPAGAELAIATGAGNQARPAVAADGKTFLVAWQEIVGRDVYRIAAARLGSDGGRLDEAPVEVAAKGASPAACGSGGKFLVTWDAGGCTKSAVIDAATAEVSLPVGTLKRTDGRLSAVCADATAIAGDGRTNFMTVSARNGYPNPWGWGGPGAVLCSRVLLARSAPDDGVDFGWNLNNVVSRKVPNVVDTATWGKSDRWEAGAPGGFRGTADGLWPNGRPAVACDGRGGYVFAWVKGKLAPDNLNLSNHAVWLRGMHGDTLAVTLTDRAVGGTDGADQTQPVLAAGAPGRMLLVYLAIAPGKPRRIVARELILQ